MTRSAARVSSAGPKTRRLGLHALQLVGRARRSARSSPASGHGGQDHQVAQPLQQVGDEPARVVAALDHPVDRREDRGAVARGEGVDHLVQQRRVGVAEQGDRAVAYVMPSSPAPASSWSRMDIGVTRRTRAGADDQRQRGRLERDVLLLAGLLQQLAQRARRDEPERVVVRTRPDRPDDLLRLGRREDELQVRRRLLDELQQRVEPLRVTMCASSMM